MTSTADVAAADAIGGPNPIVGIRRKDLADPFGSVLAEVARHPGRAAVALGRLASAAAEVLRGTSTIGPGLKDRRFLDDAWSQNLWCRRLMQLYLMTGAEIEAWLAGTSLSALDRERARYAL